MSKKAGIAMLTAGVVLIISALLLFAYNRHEDAQAGQEAENLLKRVETAVGEVNKKEADTENPDDAHDASAALDPEMPTVMLDDYEYVGYVEIPVLELKLPVMSEWDYTRLKTAPCRQFGSTRTDDLVIAAHNFESHFGRLKDLSTGDTVIVTDMEGIINIYSVAKIETLAPNAVDAVQNSGYDLVLYTCTKGGKTRVTVFCDRASNALIVANPVGNAAGKLDAAG